MSWPKGVGCGFEFLRIVEVTLTLVAIVAICSSACKPSGQRRSVPAEVESAIASVADDIAQERYDKIYNEASDLWRRDSTAEQSAEVFRTLRSKLGNLQSRTLQTAIEQTNSAGPLKGEAYIITYQSKFERGEGMETFTLIKQDGRWLLARYFVSSTNLK
jgi:hypothetical protein